MLLTGLAYLIAAATAVLAAFYCLPRAERWGLIDTPGGRKAHAHATPLVGGLIIWAGLLTLLAVAPTSPPVALLTLATLTVVIGLLDDRHELSAWFRLGTHLALGLAMALWAGIKLDTLGELVPGQPLALGLLALPVTCFAVAAAMNAINMVDGVDGLAGGLSLLPVAMVAALALQSGTHPTLLLTATTLAGGLTAFLLLNFPFPWRQRASTFLGDTGSTLLGLMVAGLLIQASAEGLFRPVLALYLLALPLLDTAGVMVRRSLRGVSLTTPGRDHFHHVFIDAGMQHKHAVYMLVALASVIAGLGLLMEKRGTPEWTMFMVFVGMLVINLVVLRSADKAKELLRDRLFSQRM